MQRHKLLIRLKGPADKHVISPPWSMLGSVVLLRVPEGAFTNFRDPLKILTAVQFLIAGEPALANKMSGYAFRRMVFSPMHDCAIFWDGPCNSVLQCRLKSTGTVFNENVRLCQRRRLIAFLQRGSVQARQRLACLILPGWSQHQRISLLTLRVKCFATSARVKDSFVEKGLQCCFLTRAISEVNETAGHNQVGQQTNHGERWLLLVNRASPIHPKRTNRDEKNTKPSVLTNRTAVS